MARETLVLFVVALAAIAACQSDTVSAPPEHKLPRATETNVHRSDCGDPNGDAAALAPDAQCEEDAGAPHLPCKTDDECESKDCSAAGFCKD